VHISSLTLHLESRNLVNEEALAYWGGGAVAPKTKQTLQLIHSVLIVDNIRLNLSRLLTKTTVVYGKNHTNNMNTFVVKNTEVPKKKKGVGYQVTGRTFPEIMLVERFPEVFQTIPTWGKLFPPRSGLFIGA